MRKIGVYVRNDSVDLVFNIFAQNTSGNSIKIFNDNAANSFVKIEFCFESVNNVFIPKTIDAIRSANAKVDNFDS